MPQVSRPDSGEPRAGSIPFSVREADGLSLGFRLSGLGEAGAALNRSIQPSSGTDKPLNPEFHTLAALGPILHSSFCILPSPRGGLGVA